MRITNDIKIAQGMLEEGFYFMESYNVVKFATLLHRNNAYTKGKYVAMYFEIAEIYNYARNEFRDKVLSEMVDLKKFKENYKNLYAVIMNCSDDKTLEDWQQVNYLDSAKFLTMVYDVVMALVDKENIIGRVFNKT
jgi:hypothetical protein